jgi:RNA polymerase sigma-70 factor, ECF subfamily
MTPLDVAAHVPRLRRHARFLCRNAADADDLVQETLVKAMARADLFRPGGDLGAWLYAILHNTFLSGARAYARRQRAAAVLEEAGEVRIEAAQEARVELRRTLKVLDQLPDEQRRVILLVSVEGMTTEEAAAVLGMPVGTVRSRLARGRDALRRLTRRDASKNPTLRLVGGRHGRAD